jgi:hypothetical protein
MPSRQAIEHEQMRWGYMNTVDLSRRITRMTKRDKLDAFLHYAFEVWSGREPANAHVSLPAVRTLIMEAIERCRTLRFNDLTGQYSARFQIGQESQSHRATGTRTFLPPSQPARQDGRIWADISAQRMQAVINVNRSSWPSGTLSTFTQLLNPNMRNSIFQNEEYRRPLITAMWEFFQGVATGEIHGAECHITRRDAVELMRRLRDTAGWYGCHDLERSIAQDHDQRSAQVLQWETNQRLEGERLMAEAAANTRKRQGIRLIRFPKKKKEETLESLMEDTSPRQPTIDEILGLGEDDEW